MRTPAAMIEAPGRLPHERLREEMEQRLRGMVRALSEEIRATRQSSGRGREVPLVEGRIIAETDGGTLYAFRLDRDLTVPPGTAVVVRAPGASPVDGEVVAVHDFEVLLHLRSREDLRRGRLSLTPWKITRRLQQRLEALLPALPPDLEVPAALLGLVSPEPLGREAALPRGREMASLLGTAVPPNDDQCVALARCCASVVHYVWGPPGTGKTTSLAQVVRALVAMGERVMVVSHANVAVDVAMLAIADAFQGSPELASGRILRLGPPQMEAVRRRPEILVDGVLGQSEAELRARLLGQASVVGTTLARATLDDGAWQWPADTLVVDETGMAPFPSIMALACRGAGRVLLFGDFRQLAPVSQARGHFAQEWLARDAFAVAGVPGRIDLGVEDARVTMLTEQHRFAPGIADVVSALAYGRRLVTSPATREATAPLADRGPWPGSAIRLVDTHHLGPRASLEASGESYSRVNPVHLALALSLHADVHALGHSVGVVTPYRAQALLVSRGLEQSADAATVHRFQGAERDFMILDLVDAPPLPGASMLTGVDADTARRLANVAISRARGRLIVLADVPFVRETHPPGSPLRVLLESMAVGAVAPDPASLCRCGNGAGAVVTWFDSIASVEAGMRRDMALLRAGAEVVIHVPQGHPVGSEWIEALRDVAAQSSVTLFAPPPIARRFEDLEQVDLRLSHPPGGFFAFLGDEVAYVGGESSGKAGALARLERAALVRALRVALLGRNPGWGLRRAAVEAAVLRACGRCAKCGRQRRPKRTPPGWRAACPQPGHPAPLLDTAALQSVAEELRCPTCKKPGLVKGEGADVWIECRSSVGSACAGPMPSLEELLGGEQSWPR